MTIDDYEDGGRLLYAEFAEAVAGILRAAISQGADLRLQNIQHRAKDVSSLRSKLQRANADADADIGMLAKDVAGCRLIFYTNGDVYRFGQSGILRDNFEIDFDRSKIHYPQNADEGAEFFISENWVLQFTEARSRLPEYSRFAGLSCEIQVQTVLDHAWAEMAHDTIYKPMTDVGFGSAAVEAMRGRLRRVMQKYLQPAGYEFQKIASDYDRLRQGKSLFDHDALAAIRACSNRNSLTDAIERFSIYVLPHYDDFRAWGPDIIATMADAAVRAVSMPDVPHKTHWREFPGTKVEAVLSQVCRVLQTGYLLYIDPPRMFDAIVAMRATAEMDEQSKPIDDLARRFARHDRRAWQQVGPSIQRMIVDQAAALDDTSLVAAASVITPMLEEVLSSTVTGTTLDGDTVTFHTGAVPVSEALTKVRRDALHQLERLHELTADEKVREAARKAMLAAGSTPNNVAYSDELGAVAMDDLTRVIRFFSGVLSDLGLEYRRRLEAQLFRVFYRYHVLPPSLAGNAELVSSQARLMQSIADCRERLDGDRDLPRYRLLVGYDSISRRMWEEASYDHRGAETERTAGIDALVATVSAESADEWLADLERYVQTRSADGATFLGLQEFIKKVAANHPAVMLSWLPRLSDRLADWLPGMLHGLVEADQGDAVDQTITGWVADGKHLSSIAYYLQFAERFRFHLLVSITDQAIASGDKATLGNVAVAAVRQTKRHADGLFEKVFQPAARALAQAGDHRWLGGMFNWEDAQFLQALAADQAAELLSLLVDVPRLEMRGEDLLGVVAKRFPQAVLNLMGERFQRERQWDEFHYEDFPHELYHLREPLSAVPEMVVKAAKNWFDAEPMLAQFRGGRLIAELFPQLEDPIQDLLRPYVETGRDGLEFVLSVLRAYEGQAFLHPLLRDIVDRLDPGDDELRSIVHIVIESSGVLVGEYGSVEAQENRKALVAAWAEDERPRVQEFATRFIKSAENTIAWQRRFADQSVASRRIDFD